MNRVEEDSVSSEATMERTAADVLREHGHALIERMAAHLEGIEARAVSTRRAPGAVARDFDTPLPREGMREGSVWGEVWERVAGEAIQLHHPMYLGHQVAPPLPHAVLADALASLLNQSTAVWEMSPTGTFVEGEVIRWMRELLGYPAASDGTFVSGGSVANLTGLLAAREARFPGAWRRGLAATEGATRAVVLASAHSHYSVDRALGLMGLGADAFVPVPSREGRMDVAALGRALGEARAAGRVPLAVVATAGSTPTGAFDDLEALADVAAAERVWLHVDGAHGASFLASERLRPLVRGIGRADSVAWDPHKMLFMPISLGAIFVRERRHLDAAFEQSAPYLFQPRPDDGRSYDIGRHTLQCSRRLDALKLWVALRQHGVDYFGRLQERTVATTALLHAKLRAAADFEPMHVPDANILCFRHLPERVRGLAPEVVNAFQAGLRERFNASGKGWLTATVLDGRRVLRVTVMNPRTGEEHLERLLAGLREEGEAMR